jgi:hypothetical protein
MSFYQTFLIDPKGASMTTGESFWAASSGGSLKPMRLHFVERMDFNADAEKQRRKAS